MDTEQHQHQLTHDNQHEQDENSHEILIENDRSGPATQNNQTSSNSSDSSTTAMTGNNNTPSHLVTNSTGTPTITFRNEQQQQQGLNDSNVTEPEFIQLTSAQLGNTIQQTIQNLLHRQPMAAPSTHPGNTAAPKFLLSTKWKGFGGQCDQL